MTLSSTSGNVPPMQRRDFIKVGCGVCLLGLAGATFPKLLTPAHAARNRYDGVIDANNEMTIPLDEINGLDYLLVNVRQWSANMAVHQKDDGTYLAMLLLCTHMENGLLSTGHGFLCTEHGSKYDLDGNVLQGPAEDPLQQFTSKVVGTNLVILAKR
jgi:Rieske Fe-S protein